MDFRGSKNMIMSQKIKKVVLVDEGIATGAATILVYA
jgi:predicted phosphoribosyltransferase